MEEQKVPIKEIIETIRKTDKENLTVGDWDKMSEEQQEPYLPNNK